MTSASVPLGPSSNAGLSATHFSFPASVAQSGRPLTAASSLLGQITPAAGGATSIDVTVIIADATSALANIEGLTGNLLSTVIAQVASAISLVGAAGPLPTANLAGQGFPPSIVSIASQTINAATAAVGGLVQPVATPVTNPVQAAGGAIAGNGLLRLKATESATQDDTMPVITMVVNAIPADQNNVAALLSVFNGAKGKRRLVERKHERTLENVLFCVEHPEHDSCRE